MSSNRSQWFYSGVVTTTTSYAANAFKFDGALNTLRIQNDSGNVLQFTIKGIDNSIIDGDVLANEELLFRDFQGHKIAIKSAAGGDTCRIWAY